MAAAMSESASSPASSFPVAALSPTDLYNLLQDSAIAKDVFDVRRGGGGAGSPFAQGAVRTSLHVTFGDSDDDGDKDVASLDAAALAGAQVARYVWDGCDEDLTGSVAPAPVRNGWTQRGLFPANVVVLVCEGQGRAEKVAAALVAEGKVKAEKVRVLAGGYAAFEAQYRLAGTSEAEPAPGRQALPGLLPSEIEEGFLYLGSYENAKSWETLEALGITHVLNVADELLNPHEESHPNALTYAKYGVNDTAQDDIAKHFEACLAFLRDARDSAPTATATHAQGGKNRVLVHCAMGISRSSAVTIAYLMTERGMKLVEAREFVQARRSSIKPNPGFTAQLEAYEKAE